MGGRFLVGRGRFETGPYELLRLRGAKGECCLVFNRVVGHGFVVFRLSRLVLSNDRARQSLVVGTRIEIFRGHTCPALKCWGSVCCGGDLHGSGGGCGDRIQRLYFGGRADC